VRALRGGGLRRVGVAAAPGCGGGGRSVGGERVARLCDLGYCSFYQCRSREGELPPLAEPGTITISGGSRELELTAAGGYDAPEEATPLFTGGEPLTFRVEGGDGVDPHESELVAPGLITVGEPVFGEEPLEIDRLVDFPVAWTGGSGDYVQVDIAIEQIAEDGEKFETGLACQYQPNAQRVVVPNSLLRALPAVSDVTQARLTIGAWTWTGGEADRWLYGFYASAGESHAITLK
jgi:hypothetical protein